MQSDSAVESITCSALLDRLLVGDLLDEARVGVLARVGAVDALHPVLGHQDRLRVDLERPQRRRGVGREERVARARGEDHDPALLEVAHGAAPDVGLGDLGDRDRGLHARVTAPTFSSASWSASAFSTVASIPM